MTRFDDLGLAGYERGGGYRPDGLTMRGALSAFAWVALLLGGLWLVRDAIGETRARLLQGILVAATVGWASLQARRRPLGDDEYATDEERRAARRGGAWGLVCAALLLAFAVATYLSDMRHGR